MYVYTYVTALHAKLSGRGGACKKSGTVSEHLYIYVYVYIYTYKRIYIFVYICMYMHM